MGGGETEDRGGKGALLALAAFFLVPPVLLVGGVLAFTVLFMGMFGGSPANAAPPCRPVSVPTDGDHVATAMGFFMGRGLTAGQAAGLVGNMQVESGAGLDPHAKNSLGYQGIVQWDPVLRWPRENKFAKAIGKSPYALAAQLRYAAWEIGVNNEWKGHPAPYASVGGALRNTHNPDNAAKVIFDQYEVPGDSSLPKRQAYARADAAKYGHGAPPASPIQPIHGASAPAGSGQVPAASGCGGTNQGELLAFQQTVLKYAWPNWQEDGRLKQMPGYKAAVARAVKEHRFAGQSEAAAGRPVGDDCAAFIALLMHDSGWDPAYDYGDKLPEAGYVPKQQQWLKKHWKSLGPAAKLTVADLQPGDIGISNAGGRGLTHVWVYVGSIPGFHGQWAEASYKYGKSEGFAPQARDAAGVLYSNVRGVTYYRRKGVSASGKWMNPLVTHHTITSPYGWRRNPGQGGARLKHQGVDLAVPAGTTIHSACTGKVISRENVPRWGGYETGINCGGGIYVYYMHQSQFLVQKGQHITVGQAIGKTGGAPGMPGSGDSVGPHLHFQVQHHPGANDPNALKTTIDPVTFMSSKGVTL